MNIKSIEEMVKLGDSIINAIEKAENRRTSTKGINLDKVDKQTSEMRDGEIKIAIKELSNSPLGEMLKDEEMLSKLFGIPKELLHDTNQDVSENFLIIPHKNIIILMKMSLSTPP